MIPSFPVYLFDVDGTLLESAGDICGAIQDVLVTRGRSDVPNRILRDYIGRHLTDLFLDLGFPQEEIEPMVDEYRRIYPLRNHAQTRIYPGIPEMLQALGGRKSTATTKGTPMTRAVLDKFGLIAHFDHVQGTDGFPAKPEPDVVLASLRVLNVAPEECLLIGDAAADMEAGRRAGVKTCAVRWGYGKLEEMAMHKPDFWIDQPEQLLGV